MFSKDFFAPVIYYDKNEHSINIVDFEKFIIYHDFNNEKIAIFCEGTGVIKGKFIKSTEDLYQIYKNRSVADLIEDVETIRGAIAIYIYKYAGEAFIFCDPFGYQLIYKYEDDDLFACSTDLRMLKLWLKLRGISLKPSLLYSMLLLTLTNGGFSFSSIEKIEVVPAFAWMYFTADGVRQKYYDTGKLFDAKSSSVDDLFDEAAQEITDNLRAIYRKSDLKKIVHLTGGKDSRLVLAGILALREENDTRFYCNGIDSADHQLASGLASHYRLTMTDDTGLISRYTLENDAVAGEMALDFCSGMFAPCIIDDAHARNDRTVVIGGFLGEAVRNPYLWQLGNRLETDDPNLIILALYPGLKANNAQSLTHPLIADVIRQLHVKYLNWKMSTGTDIELSLYFMYLEQRCRYLHANIMSMMSRKTPRFDILYSPAIVKLVLALDKYKRNANYGGFKLMDMLAPGLSEFEFEYDPVYVKKYFPHVATKKFDKSKPDYEFVPKKPHVFHTSCVNTRHVIDKARKLGVHQWQISMLEYALDYSRRLYDKYAETINEIMNQEYINILLKNKPETRQDIRNLHQLSAFLMRYDSLYD